MVKAPGNYNLKTGKLFTVSDLTVPPIDTESGPNTGLRAFVYSIGNCSAPDQRFINYLETLMPGVRKAVQHRVDEFGDRVGIGMAMEKLDECLASSLENWTIVVPMHRQKNGGCREIGNPDQQPFAGYDKVRPLD